MRRLVWLSLLFALAWSTWWFVAASGARNGIETWLADRRSEGWQADESGIHKDGFPTRLKLTLNNPALADPATGVAFTSEALRLDALALWPGHLKVTLPTETFRVASPLTQRLVKAEDGLVELRLRPGPALELERAAITSNQWEVSSPHGTIWQASGLVLHLEQSAESPEKYSLVANAPAFVPGGVIRHALRIPQDWPVAFDAFQLRSIVTFDRPIDRRTIEQRRPQPRDIELEVAEAVWGTLSLRAAAQISLSDTGLLNGTVMLQARNWQEILNLAEATDLLPASIRPQVENILAALARGSGNPASLDVSLEIDNGRVFLGFIPLGELPPVILR